MKKFNGFLKKYKQHYNKKITQKHQKYINYPFKIFERECELNISGSLLQQCNDTLQEYNNLLEIKKIIETKETQLAYKCRNIVQYIYNNFKREK